MDEFTNLRDAVANADSARSLNLREKGLRKLPPALAKLTRLETLNLSANPLRQMPEELFSLTNLRRLHIDGTLLDEIPPALGQLTQLTELSLGGFNRFIEIPDALFALKRLQVLDLTDATKLQRLPKWLTELPELQELRLVRASKIANLTEIVEYLPHLRRLVLDDVPLTGFTQRPTWLPVIERLEISRTQLSTLPEWLGEMQALESLDLDSNPDLVEIPPALGSLSSLRELTIYMDRFAPLPAELGQLARLERLRLVRCNLKELPDWIFGLSQLKLIYVGLNPITQVSPEISRLTNLKELDFGYNPELTPMRAQLLAWLPDCKLDLTPLPEDKAEKDVPEPVLTPYVSLRNVTAASQWPEFASLAAWQALTPQQQAGAAAALVSALGPQYTALPTAGAYGLPRFYNALNGLTFLVVVGGQFMMGLREEERKALKKLTKGWSPEARAHVRDIEAQARPLHEVKLPPFLCAQSPVTAEQTAEKLPNIQTAGSVCLFDITAAMDFAVQTSTRLLSEAEWEYIARRGGTHTWIGLEGAADQDSLYTSAEAALEQDLRIPDESGFGVAGLGWGTWVEDAWRPVYMGAPVDGSARLPQHQPDTLRGGALLSWPWQMDGEALLLHGAQRERARKKQAFPLLLAVDLPKR